MTDLTDIRQTRFWKHVEKTDTCWLWTAALSESGYGIYSGHPAHQTSYRLAKGDIPAGLQLDHVCHDPAVCAGGRQCPHRRCVNPDHLEAVTPQENSRRALRGACRNGHPYSPENTYRRSDGTRTCQKCSARKKRRYQNTTAKRHGHRINYVGPGDWRCLCGHPLGRSQAKARPAMTEHSAVMQAEDLAPKPGYRTEWAPTGAAT